MSNNETTGWRLVPVAPTVAADVINAIREAA